MFYEIDRERTLYLFCSANGMAYVSDRARSQIDRSKIKVMNSKNITTKCLQMKNLGCVFSTSYGEIGDDGVVVRERR